MLQHSAAPFGLSLRDVAKAMEDISERLKSFVYRESSELAVPNDAGSAFEFGVKKFGHLGRCTVTSFGERRLASIGLMSAAELFRACIGAYLHREVFGAA